MSFPHIQKGNLETAPVTTFGAITKFSLSLNGLSVSRFKLSPGASWSRDIKPHVNTDSCQLGHVAVILSGNMTVKMDDGTEQTYGRMDVMMVPPGHNAWVNGEEDCEFVEFERGSDYYADRMEK
jgi:quercetin dioxygenase-like cupin family protein